MNLQSILAIVSILPQLLSTVQMLVEWAESGFSKQGSGAFKREFVLDGLRSWAAMMAYFSTGGQKETWETITENFDSLSAALGSLIDMVVALTINRD